MAPSKGSANFARLRDQCSKAFIFELENYNNICKRQKGAFYLADFQFIFSIVLFETNTQVQTCFALKALTMGKEVHA